ncbi:MAG: hypothetical protein AB7H93_22700 [Vicinamibacterales bacterium]
MVGALLAIAVAVFARIVGLDRDRAFYPTVMIVIAALYSLFAVMGGSTTALLGEMTAGAVFVVAATYGFRSSLWIVAAALTGHGIFDFVHGRLIANPGVPVFWPAFCGAYDVVAGAVMAWLLAAGRIRARA